MIKNQIEEKRLADMGELDENTKQEFAEQVKDEAEHVEETAQQTETAAAQESGEPQQTETAAAQADVKESIETVSAAGKEPDGQLQQQAGYAYTSNGQYMHYQMQNERTQQNMQTAPSKQEKKEQKRLLKMQKKVRKAEKKAEKKAARGHYPFGTRIAAALLCGILFAGAAYGTCYGIEKLTGTKLLYNGDEIQTGISSVIEIPQTSELPQITGLPQNNAPLLVTTGNSDPVVMDATKVAKEVMPAIVTITNNYTQTIQYWGYNYHQKGTGSGSGIIVGQNGEELLICTNYHVIEDTEKLTVKFIDNEEVRAAVKGTDSRNDLAVISVKLSDIKKDTLAKIAIAKLGDSDKLQVGEAVLAIGNALGYGQSVTAGVVSALNRQLEDYQSPMIQTDAAINPGNSGGALLNARGEVVGIPSVKIGGSSVEGMGYAIPISVAEPILRELMQNRTKLDEDERGYLGIRPVDVDSNSSMLYNMPEGVYIYQVYEGCAAERAGLKRGDIITHLNGKAVADKVELIEELSYCRVGEKVTVTVCRVANDYLSEDVEVILGSLEEINS